MSGVRLRRITPEIVQVPVRISVSAVPVAPTWTVPLCVVLPVNVLAPVTVSRPATVVVWPAQFGTPDKFIYPMPAWKDRIMPQHIDAVLAYLKTLQRTP